MVADPSGLARAEELAREAGVTDDARLAALAPIAAVSRLLGRWLATHPAALARLAAPRAGSILGEARARRAAEPTGPDGLRRALREFRLTETARALRADLDGRPMVEVSAAIADIAAACFDIAVTDALAAATLPRDAAGAPIPFAVIGMGKLGGRELNLSSDVDVVYVHGTDRAAEGDAPAEAFARVARSVTRALADVTEDGTAFRVDLDLRPEGTRGPVTNSLRSLEVYYESYGQTWERAAWLKARPVAGDEALGDAVMRAVEPFVYRKWLDFATLDAIAEMKEKIDRSRASRVARTGAIERGYDVKLGAGGIREVEFFVQALQLVNAGKRPEVRSRGTPDGLARLAAAGLVPERDAQRLTTAWEFLRRLEHRLQARELAQTHSLPTDDAELAIIAASMGFPREGSALLSTLATHRAIVADAFDGLFREKSRQAAAESGPETALLGEEGLSDERATELAAALNLFADPRAAAEAFARIRRGPARSPQKERAFRYLARIAPPLFRELKTSPDPDAAVTNLERFLSRIGGRTTLLAILAEHPPSVAMLTRLFGTSEFLSASFSARPELLDVLLGSGIAEPVRRRAALRAELAAVDAAAAPSGLEARLDALRRFRAGEILRIGIADLGASLDLEVLQRQLTMVAETVVERAFAIACAEEDAPRDGLVVLGMGRLGSREMAYASDVDLVFFCEEFSERHVRVAQRVLSVLSAPTREGVAYRVDTRLRPSGSAGVLVVSRAAFRTYHETQARTWERQAWTRARPVAGDLGFWRRARAEVRALTFRSAGDCAALAGEVREMRETMEKQIGRPQTATYNMKTGRGGLVDVEFAAQFLQLCHGLGDPSTRSPHTLTALRRSCAAGHLSTEDFSALAEGYRFVHHLENRLRIVADRPVDEVPASDEAWDSLARRARVAGSGKELRAEYERISSAVRAAFERVLKDV